jgi:hypothetical protein
MSILGSQEKLKREGPVPSEVNAKTGGFQETQMAVICRREFHDGDVS